MKVATKLYSPKEFAELFGLTTQGVTRNCRKGKIKAFQIGCTWKIPFDADEIERMADENKRTA